MSVCSRRIRSYCPVGGEPFTRFEPSRLANASIRAVNLSEVLARLEEIGMPECTAASAVARLNLRVITFGVLLTLRAPTPTGATAGGTSVTVARDFSLTLKCVDSTTRSAAN